ncbi:MAG: preprotein translocase subunit SecE [Oscillospiraceae bacterium]|nr:preprotein translocase subunit SecE [Oscillospiraceae bacterium]
MDENKDKTAAKEAKAAAKAAAKAKQARIKQNKPKRDPNSPNIFKRIWAVIMRFIKDFRGTIKKVNWPDRKTVIKNFGVVLAVVLVIGAAIWIVDYALSSSIGGVMNAVGSIKENRPTTTANYDDYDYDDDLYYDSGESETEAAEGVTENADEGVTEAPEE